MEKKAIAVVGLGFGDEGKGATTDYLVRLHNSKLVVRYCGGPQCSHRVELPDGTSHVFSQFGSGTLAGASTYLDRNVIIDPPAMRREAEHLKELGIRDPFELIMVHPKCLVTTSIHRYVNREREIGRGDYKHGSCGQGVGETRKYWLEHGQDAIFAEDLNKPSVVREKLELLRQRMNREAGSHAIKETDQQLLSLVLAPDERFRMMVPLPTWNGTAIFEGAQGVLLDEWHGFHPHTTYSTVTDFHAQQLCDTLGAKMEVMGVTRLFPSRHGAGPFPTERGVLQFPDLSNPPNEYQGTIRFGLPDLVSLRYAASVLGRCDGIAVTCIDHQTHPLFSACVQYLKDDVDFKDRDIYAMQRIGDAIQSRKDERSYDIIDLDEYLSRVGQIAPVRLVSDGPAWSHRRQYDSR